MFEHIFVYEDSLSVTQNGLCYKIGGLTNTGMEVYSHCCKNPSMVTKYTMDTDLDMLRTLPEAAVRLIVKCAVYGALKNVFPMSNINGINSDLNDIENIRINEFINNETKRILGK